jgi:hypothetical protein
MAKSKKKFSAMSSYSQFTLNKDSEKDLAKFQNKALRDRSIEQKKRIKYWMKKFDIPADSKINIEIKQVNKEIKGIGFVKSGEFISLVGNPKTEFPLFLQIEKTTKAKKLVH